MFIADIFSGMVNFDVPLGFGKISFCDRLLSGVGLVPTMLTSTQQNGFCETNSRRSQSIGVKSGRYN